MACDFLHAPTVSASKSHRDRSDLFRGFQTADDVLAVPRSGNAYGHITRQAYGLKLAGEDVLESEIIAYGCQSRRVRCQSNGRNRQTGTLEPDDEFYSYQWHFPKIPPILGRVKECGPFRGVSL